MAHALDVGDLVEASFVCKISDQYTFNVLHMVIASKVGTTVTDVHLASALSGVFAPRYKDLLTDASQFWGLKCQVIKPTRYDAIFDVSGAGDGTGTGDQLPPQIAGVASLKSGFAHRSKMGRVYLPAASEDGNDVTGRPTNTYIADAQALISDYMAGGTAASGGDSVAWNPVIYSRKLSQLFAVTANIIHDSWGTIRTRSNIGKLDVAPF